MSDLGWIAAFAVTLIGAAILLRINVVILKRNDELIRLLRRFLQGEGKDG